MTRFFSHILLYLLICSSLSCQNNSNNSNTKPSSSDTAIQQKDKAQQQSPHADAEIKIEIFQKDQDKSWGYDVYIDGEHYVHQPHIPAVEGKQGFQSKEEAQKVAQLVRSKIKKGIMPPSVSINELDSLNIGID